MTRRRPLPPNRSPLVLRLWRTQFSPVLAMLLHTRYRRQKFRQFLAALGWVTMGRVTRNLTVMPEVPTTVLPVSLGRMEKLRTAIAVDVVPKPLHLTLFMLLLLMAQVKLVLKFGTLKREVFLLTLLLGAKVT